MEAVRRQRALGAGVGSVYRVGGLIRPLLVHSRGQRRPRETAASL